MLRRPFSLSFSFIGHFYFRCVHTFRQSAEPVEAVAIIAHGYYMMFRRCDIICHSKLIMLFLMLEGCSLANTTGFGETFILSNICVMTRLLNIRFYFPYLHFAN